MKISFPGLGAGQVDCRESRRGKEAPIGRKDYWSVAEIRTLAAKYAAFQQRQGLG
jgi:hypothetical protein